MGLVGALKADPVVEEGSANLFFAAGNAFCCTTPLSCFSFSCFALFCSPAFLIANVLNFPILSILFCLLLSFVSGSSFLNLSLDPSLLLTPDSTSSFLCFAAILSAPGAAATDCAVPRAVLPVTLATPAPTCPRLSIILRVAVPSPSALMPVAVIFWVLRMPELLTFFMVSFAFSIRFVRIFLRRSCLISSRLFSCFSFLFCLSSASFFFLRSSLSFCN